MLKRLFIAVFVLGLVVGLSGTALSDVAKPSSALNKVETFVPGHARLGEALQAGPSHTAFKKPAGALEQHLLPPGLQLPSQKLNYFCDVQDYTSGSPAYYWTIPDAYGDDLFNMRFTADAGHDCTLKVAWLLMYGSVQVGSPTVRVYLWDDDGFGFPGNKLDSVDVATPAPAAGLYWLSADFSAAEWVFSDGVEYHLGFTQLDQAGSVVAVISDAADGPFAGEERASENWGGAWGTMLGDWGVDVSFFIQAERCCAEIPFTDCYSQAYIQTVNYFWRAPHPAWGDEQYAEKFDVGGPETLVSVDIAIYGGGATSTNPPVTDPVGNNDIYIRVYDDNGGLPGALLETVTLPAGTYSFYPALQNVPMPAGFVLTSNFHVSFGTDGVFAVSWESCLSSAGADGSLRSSSYFDGGAGYEWFSFIDGWGLDVQFYFVANLCKDEYSDCSINACNNGLAYYWQLPDRYGDFGQAQRFSSVGEECRVDAINILWYWNFGQRTWPRYSEPSEIKVWADAGGLPGAEIASVTVNPGDYGIAMPVTASTMYWATYEVDAIVTGDYWVGVISLAPDTLHGISVLSDNVGTGGGGCVDSWAEYYGVWGLMADDWGLPARDAAMVIESEHCCIPYSERFCVTPMDWSTRGLDFARTNASMVEMQDAWCDLTLNWSHTAAAPVAFAGPIVYDNRVVCSFSNLYKVFDLNTGALLATIVPQGGPFAPGDIRCTPTVADVIGYPDPVLFVTGGTNDEVLAYNFNTYTLIWSRHIGNMGPTGVFGDTRFGVFVVMDIAGQSVLYWTTDGGRLVAADALTGALFAGWAVNPFNAGKPCQTSLATDGTSLFFGTQASGAEGDVYSIDAATGVLNWQLSATAGLQAPVVYASTGGYAGTEGFTGGIAYDAQRQWLYFASRAFSGSYPTDGVFYRVVAGTGQLAGPAMAATQTVYSGPTVDANRVYVAGNSRYVRAPFGGQIYAVDKATGVMVWSTNAGPWGYIISPPAPTTASLDGCYNSAVLSCEPNGVADLLFAFSSFGGYHCINAETGEDLYRRRVSIGSNPVAQRGFGGALNVDGTGEPHLLFADNAGRLYDLTKQADRPRLEIQHYDMKVPCPFGVDPNYLLTIKDVYTNTGCADLVITSVTVDENSAANQWIPDVVAQNLPDDMMHKAASISDMLTNFQFSGKFLREADVTDDVVIGSNDLERRTNYAAAGVPAWFNTMVFPNVGGVLLPGDTADLEFYVNQGMILRGAQSFYLQVGTNDPDFFLNAPAKLPEQYVVVVGGCLTDTSTMFFGVGAANERLVSNTGRLGTGDWGDGPAGHNGFYVDGKVSDYFQGSIAFMGSKYQVAANTDDWSGGGTAMVSMQGDPNWCDGDCKPAIYTGVTLGYMTSDGGLTYDAIMGERVCYTVLDSVQNFDAGTGWDWTWYDAPFDNALTMGLMANGRAVGATDVPELHGVTVDVLEITERNGRAVDGWYLAHFFDCDNGNDTIQYNGAYSVAWTLNGAKTQALGNVKIPFGCGYDPLVNIWGTFGESSTHGFWEWNQYWDTAYWYCDQGYGAFTEAVGMHGGDEEAHITIDAHNFLPNETYTVGFATFLLTGLTNALNANNADVLALATMVNQWAGFGRGDVNNDGIINLADIIYLAGTVNGGPGAIPFQHLSDVNADGNIDILDVNFLIAYYFDCGPCPTGDWVF